MRYGDTAVAGIGLVGVLFFSSTAHAQQPFDATHCFVGTGSQLFRSDDAVIGHFEHKGIYRSNHENKLLDGFAIQCMGIAVTVKQKRSMRGACKILDPKGDMIGLEIEDTKLGTGTATVVGGTGAWKGVTGGGDWLVHTPSRPLADGAFQSCLRYHGTLTVPK
ncbi:MAG: hypothetical protein AABM33_10200 [Pseudomonadota bacterium]